MASASVKQFNTHDNLLACDIASLCDTQVHSASHTSSCSSVASRVEMAKDHCKSLGIRFTKLRESVYRIILDAQKPLGAYDIINIMQEQITNETSSLKKIAPPTVYRSLQFLLEYGFIHRLVSINAFVPCCHPRSHHIAGFLICEACQRVQECSDGHLFALIQHTQNDIGFQVNTSMIELTGLCKECQNTE